MFNIFKKKSDPIKENLSDFQNSFTKEQKGAILCTFIAIAKADGEMHPNEFKKMEELGTIIGVDTYDPVIKAIVSGGRERTASILKTLDRSQRMWFITAIYELMCADGKIDESEYNVAVILCQDFGISEDEFLNTIKMAKKISEDIL